MSIPSRRRALLFSLLPAAILFGGAEIALRLAGFEYHGIPRHLQFGRNLDREIARNAAVPDDLLFWRIRVDPRHAPDLAARRLVHPALRDLTGGDRRDASRLRVVSLGDSCTFFGSPPYTARLERLLADRGAAAEVFNAGVPGYSSYQGLRWFESEIAGYDPDWVTVFYGWNDHWLAARTPDHLLAERRAPAAVEALVAWSRLAQAGIWLRARSSQPPPEGRPLRVPPERYRENLERLCASARGAGARVVMITAPSELDADDVARLRREGYAPPTGAPRELHEEYNALAREAAASCGATLLDFAREAEGGEGWLSEDGIHLTPDGMDRLAARLADVISGAER